MAADFGFSQEEIKSTPPEILSDRVYHMQKQAMWYASQNQKASALTSQPPAAPEPVVDDDLGLKFDDDVHPDIVSNVRKVAIEANKRMREYQQAINELRQRDQARDWSSKVEMIDAAFEALGPGYKKFFGEGPGDGLASTDPALRRRNAILMASGIDIRGQFTASQLRAALKNTATTMFGPAVEPASDTGPYSTTAPEPTKPRDANGRFTKEEYQQAALQRPTHRAGAEEPNGTSKAVKSVAALLAARSAMPDAEGASGQVSIDDFPE